MLFVSVLALSVSHSFDSSPKGGTLGKTENFAVLPRPLTLGSLLPKGRYTKRLSSFKAKTLRDESL